MSLTPELKLIVAQYGFNGDEVTATLEVSDEFAPLPPFRPDQTAQERYAVNQVHIRSRVNRKWGWCRVKLTLWWRGITATQERERISALDEDDFRRDPIMKAMVLLCAKDLEFYRKEVMKP